jgi:acyl-CoA synthetase (AMP-forming)/AMP-acid ligase II
MTVPSVMPELSTWVTDGIRAEFEAAGLWTNEVLLDRILDDAAADPAALCVVDEAGQLTRGEALHAARRLATYLDQRGVGSGDVVTVLLPNWREFVVVHHAVALLGAVLNPVLPRVSADELAHVLRTCGSRFVIAAETYRDGSPRRLAAEVAACIDSVIDVLPVRGGTGSLEEILGQSSSGESLVPPASIDARGLDTVTFTSGTEALPKAVVHSHQTTMFGLRAYTSDVLGLDHRDVIFMPSPLCHATGMQWGLRSALYASAPLVLQDRWDPVVALELIARHRCTYTLTAATFVVDLVRALRGHGGDTSSLRYVATGGAPVPQGLAAETSKVLGAELLTVFGASETYITTAVRPGNSSTGGDGGPLASVTLRIVDSDGNAVPDGAEGEILTRGPQVFLGYLGDPSLTDGAFSGDWYRFGDLGRIDAAGSLHVTGRIKDIVIRGGHNISVREIEEHLLQHPDVIDVAVVGYPDPRLGERCCAVVVPAESVRLQELTAFLAERGVPTFKFPERLEVMAELPRTTTGKVRKAELRAWLRSAAVVPNRDE